MSSKITVEVNGIPFKVGGVKNKEEAIREVQLAAEVDPLLFQNKAMSLGYDFDFETKTGRDRGPLSAFIIGVSKNVNDTVDFVHRAYLNASGTDRAELERFDKQMADAEEAFENLKKSNPISATVGEFAPTIATSVGGGALVVRGAWQLAKALSPARWFAQKGKEAIKAALDEGVSAETLAALGQTPRGQQVLSTLGKLKNPTDKALRAVTRQARQAADEVESGVVIPSPSAPAAASRVLRPQGRNTKVNAAQKRVQQQLDSQAEQAKLAAQRSLSQRQPQAGGRVEPTTGQTPVLEGANFAPKVGATRNVGSGPLPRSGGRLEPTKGEAPSIEAVASRPKPRLRSTGASRVKEQPKAADKPRVRSKATSQAKDTPKPPPSKPRLQGRAKTRIKEEKAKVKTLEARLAAAEERLIAAQEAFSKVRVTDKTPGPASFGRQGTRETRLR